jgi:lipoate-protein ligase A
MRPQQVRLLPYQVADGAWQMAADQVLLENAAEGQAALRFYGWPTATISLGYFQPEAECRAYPGLANLPLVRRPSGGAALIHDQEVTYTLALPPPLSGAPQGKAEPWPQRMHALIARALATFGVKTHLCEQESKKGPVLCFLHQTPGDLLAGSHKVAGSAQRKLRGAIMQHGGILLAQSPATPELPGIREVAGVAITPQHLIEAVAGEAARSLGWELAPREWTAAEKERIDELVRSRYSADSWNRKR